MFKVYIHTNKTNGKMYVGQTCQTPELRWKNGRGYKSSPHFYSAIKKYGWDNFEHEIIASGLTQQEANNFEELLISKLDTTTPSLGYNIALGGKNAPKSEEAKRKMSEAKNGKPQSEGLRLSNLKQVSQYTKQGEFVKHYSSIKEAAEATGICRAGIGRSANGGCCAGGFTWVFEEV